MNIPLFIVILLTLFFIQRKVDWVFQFTRKDEDGLWVVANTLVKNKQFQEARVLIKFISEKALATISLPSDIINIFSTVIPSSKPIDEKLIKRMQQLNEQMRELTERHDNLKAKFAIIDYIDTLSKVLGSNGKDELRKKIWASLINLPIKETPSKRPFYLKSQKATTSHLETIKSIRNKAKRNGTFRKNDEKEASFVPLSVQTYAPKEVAEIIGVSAQTVRRMCEDGKFPEATKTYGGHWRIPTHYFNITLEEARARKPVMKDVEQEKLEK